MATQDSDWKCFTVLLRQIKSALYYTVIANADFIIAITAYGFHILNPYCAFNLSPRIYSQWFS